MSNRFKDKVMRNEYDAAMLMFVTKHRNLFLPDGSRCTGNGVASSFWRGFDGVVMGYWDAASKKTLAYAHWRAGQDAAKIAVN